MAPLGVSMGGFDRLAEARTRRHWRPNIIESNLSFALDPLYGIHHLILLVGSTLNSVVAVIGQIVITHQRFGYEVKKGLLRLWSTRYLRQTAMYVAGLHHMISSPEGIEGIAVLTTADFFRYLLWTQSRAPGTTTEGEGGLPVPEPLAHSSLDKFLFPIQGLAALLPPAVYCTAVVLNRFQQPDWVANFALPEDIVLPEWKTPLRLAACAAGFSLKFVLNQILSHSDERRRMIGHRGKPKTVRAGPYTVVRHPVYSVMLLQQAFYSVMYWSYVPLASLSVLAGVFAVKMPIEEKAAQEDDVTGNDYTEYMKRTPSRVIPYIW